MTAWRLTFNSFASAFNSLSIYNSYITMSKFFITSAVRQSLINIETLRNSVGGQWLRLLRLLSLLSFVSFFFNHQPFTFYLSP